MPTSKRTALTAKLGNRDTTLTKGGQLLNIYSETTPKGNRVVKRPGFSFIQKLCDSGIGQGLFRYMDSLVSISCDTLFTDIGAIPFNPCLIFTASNVGSPCDIDPIAKMMWVIDSVTVSSTGVNILEPAGLTFADGVPGLTSIKLATIYYISDLQAFFIAQSIGLTYTAYLVDAATKSILHTYMLSTPGFVGGLTISPLYFPGSDTVVIYDIGGVSPPARYLTLSTGAISFAPPAGVPAFPIASIASFTGYIPEQDCVVWISSSFVGGGSFFNCMNRSGMLTSIVNNLGASGFGSPTWTYDTTRHVLWLASSPDHILYRGDFIAGILQTPLIPILDIGFTHCISNHYDAVKDGLWLVLGPAQAFVDLNTLTITAPCGPSNGLQNHNRPLDRPSDFLVNYDAAKTVFKFPKF